jgi:hypothetical protein
LNGVTVTGQIELCAADLLKEKNLAPQKTHVHDFRQPMPIVTPPRNVASLYGGHQSMLTVSPPKLLISSI